MGVSPNPGTIWRSPARDPRGQFAGRQLCVYRAGCVAHASDCKGSGAHSRRPRSRRLERLYRWFRVCKGRGRHDCFRPSVGGEAARKRQGFGSRKDCIAMTWTGQKHTRTETARSEPLVPVAKPGRTPRLEALSDLKILWCDV